MNSASAVVFDCFFSAGIAFFVGVLMGFPPFTVVGATTCMFLGKIAYEMSRLNLEEDDEA